MRGVRPAGKQTYKALLQKTPAFALCTSDKQNVLLCIDHKGKGYVEALSRYQATAFLSSFFINASFASL